ncbi:MAG: hypothetical protein QOJ15_11917 [Bradyrhizobium sp.]|nr:hypothetical protein [Bradyrhizobium sp.]
MALHRDIYWVGRQWAVTGYGMQAVDQKLKGKFDIEVFRLWEDGLSESIRAEARLNIDDFEKALAVARKHYPQAPQRAAPPEAGVLDLIEAVLTENGPKPTGAKQAPAEQPKPAVPPTFDMRIESWPAKFVPQWRVRIGR